jgi:TolB-like protein/Tfp pilus assembly protein PilF
MALPPDTRLGPYQIVAPLGAGGMGEVYRARDPRLGREVAIKALTQAFARDPERLARFEREAKLLASLNHPNIASLYGLEEVDGIPYLILELVDGESLAQRLARGALSVRETLEVGGQMASAIEAAHERGVVHRDLKPGNVMLTRGGLVKVLDFGLAKASAEASATSVDLSRSPTVAMTATGAGIILGTAAYMSPEQARGKPVDRRTDVWSFGCVLFECLAGQPAFAGETVSDLIARILEREPDWSGLPAAAPARLRELLRRCLQKSAAERPRDIGDLRLELVGIAAENASQSGAGAVAAATAAPSLAVLYFENLAKDPESEYFCAGITEDILTDLSKIKGLRVASRNAVARYRGAPADLPKVAAELGVKTVLEGSVRRAGERVRISAQLINAADGFHLWAERYDRTLQDVFAVQEEIASSIAEALRVALTPAESKGLVRDRPKDVRAYDLYLKGREQYGRYTAESLRAALDLFQQATAVDPTYALAWAGMADCHGQMVAWNYTSDAAEALRLGLEAAQRAIELNPRLPEAHKAEALVLRYAGDDERSQAALVRALEINPRFVPALTNLAVHSIARSDLAAGERLFRRALECDAQYPFTVTWLAWLLTPTGRLDEAMALTDRLRKLSDDSFYIGAVHVIRAMCHLRRGDMAAAQREAGEGLADGANPAHLRPIEAVVAARTGRMDEAQRLVDELENVGGIGAGSLLLLAEAVVRLGDPARAARLVTRQILGDLAGTHLRLDPALHPILELSPFAPRRSERALIWPLEAPMMDARVHAVFKEVRIESGIPQGSEMRAR